MANGPIYNTNLIILKADVEKLRMVQQKVLHQIIFSAHLDNCEKKKVEVQICINNVFFPENASIKYQTNINSPFLDKSLCDSLIIALNFICGCVLDKNALYMTGHIIREGGNVPISIVYLLGVNIAVYNIAEKIVAQKKPDPQMN